MEDQEKIKESLTAARALYDKYDFSGAAKAYEEIKTAAGYRGLGNSLFYLWRYDAAVAAFKESISLEPQADTYGSLGESFYQMRRIPDAMENYKKAAELYEAKAEQATAEAEAAEQCSSKEKKKEAQDKRKEAQKAIEGYADRCIDLGYCYLCLRDYDEAIRNVNLAIENAGHYPLAYHVLASVFWTQGNYKDARTEWKKAKERYEKCEAQMREGEWIGFFVFEGTLLHEVFGDLNEAERVYKEAVGIYGNSPRSWAGLTALYVERQVNDPKQRNQAARDAQRAYKRAKEATKSRDVSDVENLLVMGELALSIEDYETAKTWLKMALQKDEEQKDDERYVRTAKPNTDLGILCMRTNRCKEAIPFFKKALEIDPADLALRSNLAEAYLRDDQLEDAETEFLRVLRTAPDHIESRIGLAAVYSALGDAGDADMYDAAVTQYSYALTLADKKSGSKRLTVSELAKVRYSRGYAYVKSYEASAPPKDRRRLYDARTDFRKCSKLDADQHRGRRAVEKIDKVLPRRSPQRYMEDWGPSLILGLSFFVFLVFQLSLLGPLLDKSKLPSWLNFLTQAQSVPPSEYITVTLGSLLLMVASCYLPQLLKLKVPGIELEKTAAVDQITTLGPVGISKPT